MGEAVNIFWKADYEKIEKRLACYLCDAGGVPRQVAHIPVMEVVQVKFPRSKKKRIRKKWAKQMRYCEFRSSRWVLTPTKYEVGTQWQTR